MVCKLQVIVDRVDRERSPNDLELPIFSIPTHSCEKNILHLSDQKIKTVKIAARAVDLILFLLDVVNVNVSLSTIMLVTSFLLSYQVQGSMVLLLNMTFSS